MESRGEMLQTATAARRLQRAKEQQPSLQATEPFTNQQAFNVKDKELKLPRSTLLNAML